MSDLSNWETLRLVIEGDVTAFKEQIAAIESQIKIVPTAEEYQKLAGNLVVFNIYLASALHYLEVISEIESGALSDGGTNQES